MARLAARRARSNGIAKVEQNGKRKGGGGGKGSSPKGQWLFVPKSAPMTQSGKRSRGRVALPAQWGNSLKAGKGSRGKGKVMNWMNVQKAGQRTPATKGNGKGNGRNGKVVGKGSGKGSSKPKVANKELDKLQTLDASLKVWVAGLDEKTNWKKVKEHFKEIGNAKVALMPKGKACLAFESAADAENAISTLNGSELCGKEIEIDVWTQKERKPREPGSERKRHKAKKLVKSGFAAKAAKKNKNGNGPVASKFWEKLKVMDISLKVRVTNIAEGVSGKQLMDHFKASGAECTVADMMVKAKGTACVGFKTNDDAESAIAAVSGSDLNGQSIEVSAWTKPERSSKKDKQNDA